MSYGQVWYEDRRGPYYLAAGMKVYPSTERDHITAKNTLYNEKYTRPSSNRHSLSLASAAYQGYAASKSRVRFADEPKTYDRTWSSSKKHSHRSIREPSTTPTIVPWPSPYEDKSYGHRPSRYSKNDITIVTAEPGQRASRYQDHGFYRDELTLGGRRSTSRESYGSRSSSRDSYSGDDYMARRPLSHIAPSSSRYYY